MKKRKGVIKVCKACSCEYYVPQYRATTSSFCSLRCQNHTQYTHPTFICYTCKKQFSDSPCRSKRKFCSVECRLELTRSIKESRRDQRMKVRLKYPNRYRHDIKSILKSIGIVSCQICGYNEYPFCLEAHHKDKNPNNNDITNITLLCVICHRKLHNSCLSDAELLLVNREGSEQEKSKSDSKDK